MGVEPAALSFDAGAPFSAQYGDLYASRDGALGQARHVFLGGTKTVERWRARAQFVIVETGFGVGVNFMAVWQAWRDDRERPARLHFVSLEKHPLPAEALVAAAPAELRPLALELVAQWPLPLAGLHRCEFDGCAVTLTLALGDARELAPQLMLGADAIFLDGFAPDRNPAMWERALLRAIARLARPDCRLATWTTARSVRETLAAAGFEIGSAQGFGHKRQMTLGRYAPRYVVRRRDPPAAYDGERHAIVVGAGLAGAGCADALARRGWRVDVFDSAPARGASALPWGLMHPHFAADDNRLARLTRAGCAAALRAFKRVAPRGVHAGSNAWQACGVFQGAADEAEARRWRKTLERLRMPTAFVESLDAAAAAARVGVAPAHSGLWWPQGVVASPARLTAALLDGRGVRVAAQSVDSIDAAADSCIARASDGRALGQAPIIVIATALDAPRMLRLRHAPVRAVAGQVTHLHGEPVSALHGALAGDGTLLRSPDDDVVVGATYELSGETNDLLDVRSATRSNLARLQRLLAEPPQVRAIGHFAGVRCVSRDRLPYAGAVANESAALEQPARLRGAHFADLPRRRGVYASFALASRGLTFASLAGELIAAEIEGEPLPIERSLANALDPARVLLQRLRRDSAG